MDNYITNRHYLNDLEKEFNNDIEVFAKHWGISLERAKELTKQEQKQCQ